MANNFSNQAKISYNDTVRLSNTVEGTITSVMSAAKVPAYDKYAKDEKIAYTVSLANSSSSDITDITLTDNMGEYKIGEDSYFPLTYVDGSVSWIKDGVPQTAELNASVTGNKLVITGISVKGLGTAQVTYVARANEFAPLGTGTEKSIVNSAEITSSVTTPVVATATVTPEIDIDITVSKSIAAASVPENGEIVYTVELENSGARATESADNLKFADTFNPYLKEIEVTLNGNPLTASQYTYTADGVFETVAGAISLNAAAFEQNQATGVWSVTPATATLVIKGKAGAIRETV